MLYIEVDFTVQPKETGTDILIAELSDLPFDSFEETETGCKAYIPAKDFEERQLMDVLSNMSDEFMIAYTVEESEDINWNAEWEKNYDAVEIGDKVRIHAPFHEEKPEFEYDLLIEPKMSFGTAHHPTTSQMILQLLKEDVAGKKVMDMGSGTAVLAILAKKMGAEFVDAVDNDEWAYNNAMENVEMNHCADIGVYLGDASWLSDEIYDIFIANINRNILLQDMHIYANHIANGGTLLLSGFYESDLDTIKEECQKHHLVFDNFISNQDWVSAKFIKA